MNRNDEEMLRRGPSRVIWYDPHLHQQRLIALLDRLTLEINTERVRRALSKTVVDAFVAAEQRVRERLHTDFTLAVVGNFKNGKSTLINALLESEIVTTNVTPETVTINQIRYGVRHHVEAILMDGGRVHIPLEDMPAERLVPTLTSIRGGKSRVDVTQRPHERECELRDILIDFFNRTELRDLCFELGVNDEELSGDTINDKARELIAYMRRRSRLNELIETCYRARPHIAAMPENEGAQRSNADTSRVAQRMSKLEQLRDAISHLVIEAPVDWLRGMALADTPGMADLQGFDEQVQAFLPRCDAIIFVISARSPLSEEERTFLQRHVLPRDFAKIFFVLNRMDEIRHGDDAQRVVEHVRKILREIFPGAPLFAVSALGEYERVQASHPKPVSEYDAEFERLRSMLQDSILLNRDVIRLERAVTQATQMVREFQTKIAYLQQAIFASQDRRLDLIAQCENRSSVVHELKTQQQLQMRTAMSRLANQAVEWISAFLTRFETEVVPSLAHVRLADIQRYFHFFLSDVLREVINKCLETQRPQVIDLVMQRSAAEDQVAQLQSLIKNDTASDGVVRSTFDDMRWVNLNDLNLMVDQSLVSIFSLAEELMLPVAGLLFQRQRQNEPQQLASYQQRLREMLPELRAAIIVEVHSLYHDLANEIDHQIELIYQQDINAALLAMRQAQDHHNAGRGEVAAVQTVCEEVLTLLHDAQDDLADVRQKLHMEDR